jgi:tryptophanyl-tRNA synthetase
MGNPSPKPALIHSKFLTSLLGSGGKMSASNPNSAIYMSDSAAQIKKKINRFAFSGGQETAELQRELGGNPDVDVSFQYLSYFEDDDAKLVDIAANYRKGELLTGELKAMCIAELQKQTTAFQESRAKVTDEVLKAYMTPRKLEWNGNPNPNLDVKQKYDAARAAEEKKSKKKGGKSKDAKSAVAK